MSDLEEFQALLAQSEALVKECSFDYSDDEKLRDVLARRAAHDFKLRRAEALLTEGLQRFRLHPRLLARRGDIRQLRYDEEKGSVAIEDAEADYLLAAEVAPEGLSPRYERVQLHYVHSDEMSRVAEEFSALAAAAQVHFCRCIAGRVRALCDGDLLVEARTELTKWRAIFPEDGELAEAGEWIGRFAGGPP